MKSVGVLILGSGESTVIQIARILEISTRYEVKLYGFGVENEFIQSVYNITTLKNPQSKSSLISTLLEICETYDIDIVIPAGSEFLKPLCENLEKFRNKGIEPIIPVSDPSLLDILCHKSFLFEYCKNILSLSVPNYRLIKNRESIEEALRDLNYPQTPILVSSSDLTQDRNIRLIDSSRDIKRIFFDEKPNAVHSTLKQFINNIDDSFPRLIAMEYDCAIEYRVEVLCRKGLTFAVLVYSANPLSKELDACTVLTKDQYYPVLEELVQRVIEGFGLSYSVKMRIWIDSNGTAKLVDVIPHLNDDVILCFHGGVNFPELLIDMAFQEFDYDYQPKIKWGLHMQQLWLELLQFEGDVWKTDL